MKLNTKLSGIIAASAVALLALTGCAPADEAPTETETPVESSWPRTFENADGTTTEIPSKPERVLSTSVSITGTLLAVDAPVVASGSAGNGNFFAQWNSVAAERGVENVWPAGSVDLEAAYAAEPDLIIVSTSGADSALDQLAEFQEIAPTIVLDYGGQTWQELAEDIGLALGIEAQVSSAIDDFNAFLADSKAKITVPAGEANIISFNGPGENNPIAKNTGPHAQILTALGFTLEEPNADWHTQPNQREDFVWAAYENLIELTADTTFLLSVGDDKAVDFLNDPVLANLPSVQNDQVYGLGANSFRIDLFSSTEIVNDILARFAQ